ncbi:MAG TPA: glycoside hydrolase domain-containing protein [Blastocatellia bacterium]|nr:glycoside hydrolase domain-containing protein [Blastocatellia bacterium]HMG35814.1 glycoside hydrolase domain-containing protein [Blastocatellia bacterium]
MGAFGGFDVDTWQANTCWLWRWSNLRFIGFYLNHLEHPHHAGSNWNTHLYDLTDSGWRILPLWLPFSFQDILALMPATDGGTDGRTAASAATSAGFERGATIYLDVEAQMFKGGLRDAHGQLTGQARYLIDWLRAVRTAGFAVGIYCSWLDAKPEALLSPLLYDYAPVLWPFATLLTPRAAWDQSHYRLDPALPPEWPVSAQGELAPADQTWPRATQVIGCQYDQDQRNNALTWPKQDGQPNGSRSVDWDASKVPDPAHPRASGVVTSAANWGNPDFLDVFVVRPDAIDVTSRGRSSSLSVGSTLRFGVGEIGPTPTAARDDGFDSAAAAVSRASGVTNLFVLGLDGLVRTLYKNPRDTYPVHDWALNPTAGDLARRASPLAAVTRTQGQIDLFYVDRAHRMVTQWLNPGRSDSATDWNASRRILLGPPVAGGSNLTALPSPADYANSPGEIMNRLDVFYISFDYSDPAHPNAWQVVHAQWSQSADWAIAPIPGLSGVAAASGVAATRDSAGDLHVIVQLRGRTATRHARRQPEATWSVGPGPQAPSPGPAATPSAPDSWVTVHLAALRDAVIMVGMTRLGRLAWSTWAPSGGWSNSSASAPTLDQHGFPVAAFSTGARLSLARRGPSDLDILGIAENGELTSRTLHVISGENAVLAAP